MESKGRKIATKRWDPAEHLRTDEEIAAYLDAALEDGDSVLIAAALGDVARAQGMAKIARKSGLGRESLYKALSAEGNPEFATVMKVIRSLGLKLQVHTAAGDDAFFDGRAGRIERRTSR